MKMIVSKALANQKIVCLLFVLCGGIISSITQYELLWDFVNYHYYNGWAFINNRFNKDVLMAGLNGFFNPLPDVPLYFMVKYFNDFPIVICFMQGLWFGGLMYVIYLLERLYFDLSTTNGKICAVACMLIAVTGNATFLQIGVSSNEIMLAFFALLSLYLLIHEIIFLKTGRKSVFIWAGFLLGVSFGLKLTGVIYCAVSGIILFLFYKKIKNPWSNIAWFTLFGFLGFMLCSGFWIWKMWVEFQNPFFPFANFIFKSDWMVASNFLDQNFRPQNWKEFLVWPLILSLTLRREEGNDMFISDFRFAVIYFILLYFVGKCIYMLCRRKKIYMDDKWLFLLSYLAVSYLVWAYFFSISRYFVVGEVLMAFPMAKVLLSKNPQQFWAKSFYYSFLVFIFFVLLSTPYFSNNWGTRGDWKRLKLDHNVYIGIEKVNIPDNALIMTYNYPTAAFFTYWAEKNPSIKGVNIFQQIYSALYSTGYVGKDYFKTNPKWQKMRDDMIKNHKGPKLLLVANGFDGIKLNMDFSKIEEAQDMRCYYLRNNMLPYISLCAQKSVADEVFNDKSLKLFEGSK